MSLLLGDDMRSVRSVLGSWKTLIAAFAICATAPPAKADIDFTIQQETSPGVFATIDSGVLVAGTGPGPGNLPSTTIGGTTFTISNATYVKGLSMDQVSYSATVASSSAVQQIYVISVYSTGGTFKSVGPLGTVIALQTSLTETSSVGSNGLSASSQYTSLGGQTKNDGLGVQGVLGQTVSDTPVPFAITDTTNFDLSAISTEVQLGANASVGYGVSANILLPEPSGIASAWMGLPCMALLMGFSRLRRRLIDTVNPGIA
jgi:hypothetical protein